MQPCTKAGKVIKLALRALHVKNTKLTKSVKYMQYASRITKYERKSLGFSLKNAHS